MNFVLHYIFLFITASKSIFAYNAHINIRDNKQLNYSGKIRLMNEFYDEASEEYKGKIFKKHTDKLFSMTNSTRNLNNLNLIKEKPGGIKVKA